MDEQWHAAHRQFEAIIQILRELAIEQNQLRSLIQSIIATQATQGKQLMAIDDDINNLVATVTSITADVAAILAQLAAAPNINPAQTAQLQSAITSLQTVDASLKAAVTPPVPAPGP